MSEANIQTARTLSEADVFQFQDECLRTKQYQMLGRVKCIVFEAAAGANVPRPEITKEIGDRMDWMDGGPRGCEYPMLAQSGGQLMIVDQVPPLPPMPKPGWVPGVPIISDSKKDAAGNPCGPVIWPAGPPMIEQRFEDFARGWLGRDAAKLIFGPVAQILVHPHHLGVASYWIVQCAKDYYHGTQMDFLVDVKTGRGYFIGGSFQIVQFGD